MQYGNANITIKSVNFIEFLRGLIKRTGLNDIQKSTDFSKRND